MFPFMGQPPPGMMGGGGFPGFGGGAFTGQGQGIPPWLLQMLQARQQSPFGQGVPQRPAIDWSNPSEILPQFGARFAAPLTDDRGLSALWSKNVGGPQTGPLGWNTQVSRATSPLGGLLGRFFR